MITVPQRGIVLSLLKVTDSLDPGLFKKRVAGSKLTILTSVNVRRGLKAFKKDIVWLAIVNHTPQIKNNSSLCWPDRNVFATRDHVTSRNQCLSSRFKDKGEKEEEAWDRGGFLAGFSR